MQTYSDDAGYTDSVKSIAFPAISTGVYGFPLELATKIAIKTCMDYCEQNPGHFDLIVFCCFTDTDFDCYQSVIEEICDDTIKSFDITQPVRTPAPAVVQTGNVVAGDLSGRDVTKTSTVVSSDDLFPNHR